jgi:vacuolar-type H+-ATPase subunit E/Vma4
MSEQSRPDALAEEITADAARQAERKTRRAEKRAERIIRNARKQAEETRQRILDEAKTAAEQNERTAMADVPHQKQIRTLQVKNEVIETLFTEVVDELARQAGDTMLEILLRLSADAVAAMDGDEFVVEIAEPLAGSIGDELARQTAETVGQEHGRAVSVRVLPSAELTHGGAVVTSADGRQVVDNSFDARAARLRPAIRADIADILFEEGDE